MNAKSLHERVELKKTIKQLEEQILIAKIQNQSYTHIRELQIKYDNLVMRIHKKNTYEI